MVRFRLVIALVYSCSFLACEIVGQDLMSTGQQVRPGYFRMPAIHGDTVVFVAEGDLWRVSAAGGQAQRLTTHHGEELHPVISPDGKKIAFSATYEGPREVYEMPLEGGEPQRITVEAETSVPVAWTPDQKIIYSTQHYSTLPAYQLVVFDLRTQSRQRIPLAEASDGCMASDGTLYFVRPGFHRQEVKRYQGGTARNIWRFKKEGTEAVNLTSGIKGESHSPMTDQKRVYFITDLDGTMNIWSMNRNGKNRKQHTRHEGWDVKEASLHQGRIAYRVGGDLWVLDLTTGDSTKMDIGLVSDFEQLRDRWLSDPFPTLTSARIGPQGESIAMISRGRLFVVPAKQGRRIDVQPVSGVRYRDVCFIPKSDDLLTLNDQSGEFEFWASPRNASSEMRQVTQSSPILKWFASPAPDGLRFAYQDKNYDLWIVENETGEQKKISLNREGVGGVAWSPDGQWLVFSQTSANTYSQLMLYSVSQETLTPLTSDRVNSDAPAFSADGQWLYFFSDRGLVSEVGSPWGPRQPEPYFDRTMKLYRIAMKRSLRSPFREDDELLSDAAPKKKEAKDEDDGASTKSGADKENSNDEASANYDLEGIARRVKEIAIPRGNYSSLQATDNALFWLSRTREGTDLMSLAINNQKPSPKKVASRVLDYDLSANRSKMLIRRSAELAVVPVKVGEADLNAGRVDLGQWNCRIDVREDWKQIFVDAWRMHRDYFYDPEMHGVDWQKMRSKYEPLVSRVTTRSELSDVMGQMVAELSALHTAVRGGDRRMGEDNVSVPTLGARLEKDLSVEGYRIAYIYQSDPDYPDQLSPLADPDLDIAEGDVITHINRQSVLAVLDPHLLLREQQGQQVLLTIRRGDAEPRDVIVKPTTSESSLRYRDWEYTRRRRVEEQGDGQLGYVHLRAMGSANLTEWYQNFYPVFNRSGLIVDVRHNRGGNIDSLILEKLSRRAWMYWKGRVGQPTWNMQYAFRGHVVVLCDEWTMSDGEAFAEGFRRLGLGKVIGTRTWGGEIWLTSSNRLVDGGIATAAEFGVYGPEQIWLIEGHGVEPDIVVDNLPHETFQGRDAQLERAIQFLQEQIEKDPRPVPAPPAYPDKSFSGSKPSAGRGTKSKK